MAASASLTEEEEKHLREEVGHLLISCPSEKSLLDNYYLYQYQGFWYYEIHLAGVITSQKHFQARDSDLLLASSPKSGTTWLKALAYAVLNRHNPNSMLLAQNPHDLVPFLDIALCKDYQIPDLSHLPSPRLFATHVPYSSLPASVKDSACKLLYICRNPKDIFISRWHFLGKRFGYPPLEEFLEWFCKGLSAFGPFWDHALEYWKMSREKPQKVLFLKYEDLTEDPLLQVKRMAHFMGLPFSMEEEREGVVEEIIKLCSFGSLRNLEANKSGKTDGSFEVNSYFRRGRVGDWVNFMTPEMAQRIDQITQEKFHGAGLSF